MAQSHHAQSRGNRIAAAGVATISGEDACAPGCSPGQIVNGAGAGTRTDTARNDPKGDTARLGPGNISLAQQFAHRRLERGRARAGVSGAHARLILLVGTTAASPPDRRSRPRATVAPTRMTRAPERLQWALLALLLVALLTHATIPMTRLACG